MQGSERKLYARTIMLALALMLGSLALIPTAIQAQDGPNKIFLPSVAGAEGVQSASVDIQQADSAPEIMAAHKQYGNKCRVRAQGLATVRSDFSFDETVTRLEAEIGARPLNLIATVTHSANAANIGQELRPTTLLIFGNPAVGTPLMLSDQTIGIDLPQKFLVWEDECGTVRIGYNAPRYLKQRHKIRDRDENFDNIANVLNVIATAAASDE